MRVDLYTKTVLTVIAACLVWLCVRNAPVAPVAHAQDAYQRVVIGGWMGGDGVVRSLPVSPLGKNANAPFPVESR